jgi:hypothetical protein
METKMTARRTVPSTLAHLLLTVALLTGCASSPQRSARRDLRFVDTETAGRLRHAAAVGEAASAVAPAAATKTLTASLVVLVPALVTLLESDNKVNDLEERLQECARHAERTVNASYFGGRPPTRAECGEELRVDGCVKPITRAMLLGREKHVLALQCASKVLEELWPRPFSIEQRYRYYQQAGFVETVSKVEEERLIALGCTRELWRTIKPDIVLHGDYNLLRAVLTLDFKFPCPDTNEPRWTEYGDGSAYSGSNQGKIYKEALGGEALLISPRGGVTQ